MTRRTAPWLLALLIGLPAQLLSASDAATESERQATTLLERFSVVPEFLEAPENVKAVRDKLSAACESALPSQCIAFLQSNREAVLRAMPDNPAYWDAFHAVLAGPPLLDDPAQLDVSNATAKRERLLQAPHFWVYRHLVFQAEQYAPRPHDLHGHGGNRALAAAAADAHLRRGRKPRRRARPHR